MAWLLLALLLAGCSTVEKADRNQKRYLQFQSYDHAVRWVDLAAAYEYMKPGTAVLPPPGLDNIRVTSYEEIGPVRALDENQVSRRVRIEYVLQDRQVMKSLIDEQHWAYDPEAENWYRVNPPPDFAQ